MITNTEARELYLSDLQRPMTDSRNRTRPRIRSLDVWTNISSSSKTGTYVDLSSELVSGRRIFCTSDPHFGHENIIEYCERPFANTDEMTRALIQNINNTVSWEDIIIFGGDIGFLPDRLINNILYQINGYKILVYGNHDMTRTGQLYDLDFDEKHLMLTVDYHNMTALVTHYPITELPAGLYNIHGHIHNRPVQDDYHRCISVEQINYTPILLTDIFNDFKTSSKP